MIMNKQYPCKCKFCGSEHGDKRYQGYCQSCYRYFIKEGKTLYPPYNPSEGPKFNEDGDCICPICGKAFTKLGNHLYYAHGLSSDLYKSFGWNVRKKDRASNISYRKRMKEVLKSKCVEHNLKLCGKNTQFGKPNGNPLAVNKRVVNSRCFGCRYLTSHEGVSWYCTCYKKLCKFVIHCHDFEPTAFLCHKEGF